jgi:hypothetical protein
VFYQGKIPDFIPESNFADWLSASGAEGVCSRSKAKLAELSSLKDELDGVVRVTSERPRAAALVESLKRAAKSAADCERRLRDDLCSFEQAENSIGEKEAVSFIKFLSRVQWKRTDIFLKASYRELRCE